MNVLKLLFVGVAFIGFSVTNSPALFSQSTRFKHYSVTEGLCHPFVYNINQDKNGFIWIGTGEGLCRFDGFAFVAANSMDSVPVEVVNTTYRDNMGNLWIGYNNGEVWLYDGNYFTKFEIKTDKSFSITGITEDLNNRILVATQGIGLYGLMENKQLEPYTPPFKDIMITTIHTGGDYILVGAQEGLFIYDQKHMLGSEPVQVEELNYIKIQTIKNASSPNSFWVGTEDAGLFIVSIVNGRVQIKPFGTEYGLENENIQDITYDSDSNLWISTYTSGVIKIILSASGYSGKSSMVKYNKENGLKSGFIKSVFLDREKNIWIGTYGAGVSLLTNHPLGFQTFENSGFGNNVVSVAINDSILWLGGEKGIMQINKNTSNRIFFNTSHGLPADLITSLYYRSGNLWVGTSNRGIYKLKSGSRYFSSVFSTANSISNSINYITGDDENIYIATKNGIFIINPSTGKQFHYNTINGLPHNDIEHLFIDNENKLLFATRTNGIYEIDIKGDVKEYFTVGKYELDFNSITQDLKNNIWVTTFGQGVFLLREDSVINFTVRDGLKSNYCYSIVAADSQYVWVGHRLGISRIHVGNYSISVLDSDNGITGDCNQDAAVFDGKNIYFGTSEGLITIDCSRKKESIIYPKANIIKVVISDKEFDFCKPILLPYSAYKVRIDFIGLKYSDPGAVTYQYKLEGYDLEWSEVSDQRSVIYPRIEDGEYTFLLRAVSSDGTYNPVPASFIIKVKLPVWKTWWFISLIVLLVILIVIGIIKYRERQQKEIQDYLEQRLDERTREVVEQKEEIEIKNRDITDSINYAQRIQSSILPPIKKLQQNFSGSFIFYQPRNIVSGDFYWYDRIKDDKFVIVCADSTGHGVPGAFMSMIGTTLIKDICMRDNVKAPSDILRDLDCELRGTLNQNIDTNQSNDGMDIIACEIDIKTHFLRYASAMRPMIVYQNGSQIYIKGSRSSVGGQYDKEDKIFEDEGIQMDNGDLIYMFSDGYPDQFGGPIGKKFKMVRLKNLLRDIHQKPMEEQYEYVKSTFNLWKEDYEQVDDVLFMGIKI